MTTIEARHYEETRQRLARDPVVIQMAAELAAARMPLDEFFHEDGTPRFHFMLAANETYRERGGDPNQPLHLGAVGEAIYRIVTKASPK